MPIVVEVLPEKEYQQWLDSQLSSVLLAKEKEQQDLNSGMTMEEAMTLGEQVYLSLCAACHMPSGEGIPGAFPALKNSKIALGDVKKHIDIVVNGVEKSAMQAYGQQLSLKKLAAVITYERNAWGNNTGDLVQANDVQQPANK
jgi:cytochrome c oxidase subunit 2